MAIKKLCQFALLMISIHSCQINAQIVQITTHFNSILGKPTWLLIFRNVETGDVLPYLFDVRKNSNFWMTFPIGRAYRITASNLKFGPYAKIDDFCCLEDGIIVDKSIIINITGALSPDPKSVKCVVTKFNGEMFF